MATIQTRLKLSRTLALLSDLKNGESLILGGDDVLSGKVLCQSRNWPAVSKCHAQNAQDPGRSHYGFTFLLMLPHGVFDWIILKSL